MRSTPPFADDAIAYQALTARDARFDGSFFVGVTSTGIYCRPICRVRTPMQKNCRFFRTSAQAEAAAFRPCLKCRPEIAPGAGLAWSVMDASRTLAHQAASALDEHASDGASPRLAALAARLGVSDRHLRRIFLAEHGVTPLQYLQTRRLLLAKQLLTDTALPVTQVALASGFNSLRRFNAAFVDNYRMSPSRLRRAVPVGGAARGGAAGLEADDSLTVRLAYRAPYDVDALLRFVSRRSIAGVEQVDGRRIRRSLRVGALGWGSGSGSAPGASSGPALQGDGWLEAEFVADAAVVRLRFSAHLANASGRVVAAVRRWLDLDAMPHAIDAALAGLPGAPGLRLPGSVDGFELAVRAVLGQQVSVAAARTLARRLVERFGCKVATPWPEVSRTFPSPSLLAEAPIEAVATLGIVRSRAAAIVGLARAWPELAPLTSPRAAPGPLIARLCALPGIGPWTAHYIAMRALGWPDAFPPHDVAVLNAMRRHFGVSSQREAERHALAWQPWRAYAVLRLWNALGDPDSPLPATGPAAAFDVTARVAPATSATPVTSMSAQQACIEPATTACSTRPTRAPMETME